MISLYSASILRYCKLLREPKVTWSMFACWCAEYSDLMARFKTFNVFTTFFNIATGLIVVLFWMVESAAEVSQADFVEDILSIAAYIVPIVICFHLSWFFVVELEAGSRRLCVRFRCVFVAVVHASLCLELAGAVPYLAAIIKETALQRPMDYFLFGVAFTEFLNFFWLTLASFYLVWILVGLSSKYVVSESSARLQSGLQLQVHP
eukprot:TRINITY_DN16290_c2_g1_i1.p1 TRINITY_DN16290_c2_g1~~TRINITY_DN16290_c2_g1_i1.p1  ORF type:complete len:206 (+),score=17.33 TRINITY_DN16290_c2_g1_i1:229-846(+)